MPVEAEGSVVEAEAAAAMAVGAAEEATMGGRLVVVAEAGAWRPEAMVASVVMD